MQKRHGKTAVRIVERALDVTDNLPPPLRDAQRRAIFDVLSDRMRSRLREAAMHPDRVPESPATRKLRLFLEKMGEKRGRAEGKREALLTILTERGLAPTAAERARIEACTDIATLDRLVQRAITAESVAQALGSEALKTPAARRTAARRG